MIGEDIYSFITNSTALSTMFEDIDAPHVVEQNTVVQDPPSPRIWYGRSSSEEPTDLAGEGGLVESTWDFEVHADDIDEAMNVADALKRRMNGYRGTFGSTSVLGIFVDDHDDEYLIKGDASETELHVAALSARIIYNST